MRNVILKINCGFALKKVFLLNYFTFNSFHFLGEVRIILNNSWVIISVSLSSFYLFFSNKGIFPKFGVTQHRLYSHNTIFHSTSFSLNFFSSILSLYPSLPYSCVVDFISFVSVLCVSSSFFYWNFPAKYLKLDPFIDLALVYPYVVVFAANLVHQLRLFAFLS